MVSNVFCCCAVPHNCILHCAFEVIITRFQHSLIYDANGNVVHFLFTLEGIWGWGGKKENDCLIVMQYLSVVIM